MNTNKPKPTKNKPLQIVSHDRWISMNSLQSLAQPDAGKDETKEIKATEKTEEQQAPKWVKWPSLPRKGKK